MSHRKPLDPRLPPDFAVEAAQSLGVPRGRLRASDLVSPFRGARSSSSADLSRVLTRARAYLPVAPPQFAFSHVTAAAIYGIPMPFRVERLTALHVSVPAGRAHPRRPGVVGHRGLADVTVVGGLRLVVPEAAWIQIASMLTLDELIVAGDYLVRRKRALCTVERLQGVVDGSAGRRGVSLARRSLEYIRPGTDSPRESRLRLLIVRAGLPEPVVGFTVHHEGYFVGTPDLAYVELRIAIEYEGQHHRTNRDAYEDDIVRRELFRRAGWLVFLVTDRLLGKPAILIGELEALIRERSAEVRVQ